MAFVPCDCRPDRREAVGEGHIFTTMLRLSCLPFAMRRSIAGIPRLPQSRLSEAFGVGHIPRAMKAVSDRSPLLPIWFGPACVASLAFGVG